MSLDELFCDVDDFCLAFEQWTASQELGQAGNRPGPKPRLCASEIMTIIIYFHMSHYRDSSTTTKSMCCSICGQNSPVWLATIASSS
jgi:hypothetical protein